MSNPTVTFLEEISKDMSLIATPFELLTGIIDGVTFESPFVLFLMVTLESPSS